MSYVVCRRSLSRTPAVNADLRNGFGLRDRDSKTERTMSSLNRSVALYRLAFGQPRQDDLLALLDQVRDEIAPEALAQLQISLRPE